jgi:hypothetical protein
MNETIKRAIISVIIFVVVYIGANIVTGMPTYDGLVKTLEFMSAVIAAGCYWVGSNPAKRA